MRRRSAAVPAQHSHNPIVRYFRVLGPGLVTGAADEFRKAESRDSTHSLTRACATGSQT